MITDPIILTGIAVFGFFVGILAAMLGIGGGFIMVPLLIILFETTAAYENAPIWASSTSLFAIVFMSIATTLGFYFQKPRPINFQAGLAYAVMTVPGSIIGTLVRDAIQDPEILKFLFALCLAPIAAKMILFPKKGRKGGLPPEFVPRPIKEIPRKRLIAGLAIAFVGGLSAGLLGIGGGVIVVPALTIALGMSIHSAVATSAFIMIFTSAAGTASNLIRGTIDINTGLAVAAGLVAGTQIGVISVKKFGSEQLHSLFGAVMFVPLVRTAGISTALAGGNLLVDIIWMIGLAAIIDTSLFLLKFYIHRQKESAQNYVVASNPKEE